MRKPVRVPRPVRKRPDSYHHGDLRRALIQEALRTIQTSGVEALTLRTVGANLGVSRTALYRHFTDKSALLGAVAREGFRPFRLALLEAWHTAPNTLEGFQAMGVAYVEFALAHPSQYRVMFGHVIDTRATGSADEAGGPFQVMAGALAALQHRGLLPQEDTATVAGFAWAVFHGIAMLAIDGQLRRADANPEALVRYAIERMGSGGAAPV
jgi:AcrR family transcriptional regulator